MSEPSLQVVDRDMPIVVQAIPRDARLFDRYRIERKLSDGAIASVYRATDEKSGLSVALKVFDPLRRGDDVARGRFEREFEILSRIDHPGVCRALRLESGDEVDALVLEMVEGESLAARLARGRAGVAEAVDLVDRLAEILTACHVAGVVHRDLKPSNIILHPDRGPVVLDFGVAWLSSAMTLTRTGAVLGTPRYLAPELLQGGHADARADVYALGAIVFELLTGRPARQVDSIAELAALDDSPPPDVSALRPDVPAHLDGVVSTALRPRPADRFATAEEMRRALTRGVRLGYALERNLSCDGCGTPLIIDLPMCPGCGAATDWTLEPGPYAVQLTDIPAPVRTLAWLRSRYGDALVPGIAVLDARLHQPPVVLITGVSESTAESVASQARQTGCRVRVVRGRAVIGPALEIPEATPIEILAAVGGHFAVVSVLGAAAMAAGLSLTVAGALPAAVAFLALPLVVGYSRRPLLSINRGQLETRQHPFLGRLAKRLAMLEGARARHLAAAAVARAAPVLLGAAPGVDAPVIEALDAALDAASDAGVHLLALREGGDDDQGLSSAERMEISVAHDDAVLRALDACQMISDQLATTLRTIG